MLCGGVFLSEDERAFTRCNSRNFKFRGIFSDSRNGYFFRVLHNNGSISDKSIYKRKYPFAEMVLDFLRGFRNCTYRTVEAVQYRVIKRACDRLDKSGKPVDVWRTVGCFTEYEVRVRA